jgi:hydrogenase expression/formation protein HypE
MALEKTIKLGHGSGGRMTHELIERLFLKSFFNPALAPLEDAAEIRAGAARLAFTTDSYVVDPLVFPGADIGRISVCGTVNDLAVKGARPLAMAAGFIIEEGLPVALLEKIVDSMRKAALEAGVPIVTGDTKVVEKGKADKLFINTSGVGLIPGNLKLSSASIRPGDAVILSGRLADHGVAVMNARGRLGLSGDILSDAAPLNAMIARALRVSSRIRAIRDVTRGGLGTVLNEAASASRTCIEIYEREIRVKPAVENACRLLGLDPLYVANEGKAVFFAKACDAPKIVDALRADKYGRQACVIGRVLKSAKTAKQPRVSLKTSIGGTRPVLMLEGEQLPRIC